MAALSLEDTFSACGVDPTLATAFVAVGWTAETYACAAPNEEALDEVWGELVPHDELNLLRSASEPAISPGPSSGLASSVDGMTTNMV